MCEVVDEAVKAMVDRDGDTPTHFMQSARLVSVRPGGKGRPPTINEMGVTHVREALTHSAKFFRHSKPSKDQPPDQIFGVPTNPSKELSEQILARRTEAPYLPFPDLVDLIEVPIIRPDGSIWEQPGYDPETGIYYAPP
jgi:hypothetical protein